MVGRVVCKRRLAHDPHLVDASAGHPAHLHIGRVARDGKGLVGSQRTVGERLDVLKRTLETQEGHIVLGVSTQVALGPFARHDDTLDGPSLLLGIVRPGDGLNARGVPVVVVVVNAVRGRDNDVVLEEPARRRGPGRRDAEADEQLHNCFISPTCNG
jgi:hypothetical protein